jgi:hypothetical protein
MIEVDKLVGVSVSIELREVEGKKRDDDCGGLGSREGKIQIGYEE